MCFSLKSWTITSIYSYFSYSYFPWQTNDVIIRGFGTRIPIFTYIVTYLWISQIGDFQKLYTYLSTCMKFEPCAFSVLDTVTISTDDMLPLPRELRRVNDFKTSASVWKNLKMYWIKYVYNDLFLAHLSWKLKWAFLITCRPSSVRPSVCL